MTIFHFYGAVAEIICRRWFLPLALRVSFQLASGDIITVIPETN